MNGVGLAGEAGATRRLLHARTLTQKLEEGRRKRGVRRFFRGCRQPGRKEKSFLRIKQSKPVR